MARKRPGVVDTSRGSARGPIRDSVGSSHRVDTWAALDGLSLHAQCAALRTDPLPLHRAVLSRDELAGSCPGCGTPVHWNLRVDRLGLRHCRREQAYLVGDRTRVGQILVNVEAAPPAGQALPAGTRQWAINAVRNVSLQLVLFGRDARNRCACRVQYTRSENCTDFDWRYINLGNATIGHASPPHDGEGFEGRTTSFAEGKREIKRLWRHRTDVNPRFFAASRTPCETARDMRPTCRRFDGPGVSSA